MSEIRQKGQDSALERFCDALYTAKLAAGGLENLARAVNLPESNVKSYLSRKSKPTLEPLCALVHGLGADFLNEIVAPLGIAGAYNTAPGKLSADAAHAQLSHMAHLLFVIAKMLPHYRPEERRTIEYQLSAIRQMLNLTP